jgi:hypothetical protein
MAKTNRDWHEANRMPVNATRDQRIDWHVRHACACACREVPLSLRDAVAQHQATVTT